MISRINRAARRQEGFTLVELLVVIGIIGILAMLLLPQFRGMRDRARIASCQSNLKNISTQLESEYVDNESYPTSTQWASLTATGAALGRLAFCPADRSDTGRYQYYPDIDLSSAPAAPAVVSSLQSAPTAKNTTPISTYAVACQYHDGSGTTFPTSVQLFVTPDGVDRRDNTGS